MAFQLAINYRSYGGIVNCAHTVIERITKFWPDAIDNLQPERGVVDGLKPVFFRGWDQATVRYEQFLFGASYVDITLFLARSDTSLISGSRIEFGAQQCTCNIFGSRLLCLHDCSKGILVRDDKAIEKLRKEVGEIGLIM